MSGPPPLEDMSGNLVNAKKTREAKQVEHDRHMAYVKMMKAANEQPPEGTEAGANLLTCAAEYKIKAEEGDSIRKNGTCGLQKGSWFHPKPALISPRVTRFLRRSTKKAQTQ